MGFLHVGRRREVDLSGTALLVGARAIKDIQGLIDADTNGPEEVRAVATNDGTSTESLGQNRGDIISLVVVTPLDTSSLEGTLRKVKQQTV